MDLTNLRAILSQFKDEDGQLVLMGGTDAVATSLHRVLSPTIGIDAVTIFTDGDANIRIERDGADFYLSVIDGATGLDIPDLCRLPVLERKTRKTFAENPDLEGNLFLRTTGPGLSITHHPDGFFLNITAS
ncbi:MAG: hypothetical protein HYT98_02265 [Candidatus Sungbacteria bacterium]|nr:hypothetical protein [Candidatus Sungbacteria bacterium]